MHSPKQAFRIPRRTPTPVRVKKGVRDPIFLKIGSASLALFILLRFINVYGDPVAWTKQKNDLYTFLSFINVTKYPPSLLFCLLTLGIMFLILSLIEGFKNKYTNVVETYGKVPLFYFIVHWYILHPLLFLCARFVSVSDLADAARKARRSAGA